MNALRRMLISQHSQWRNQMFSRRQCSTSLIPLSEVLEKRNYIFSQEQKRQIEEVGRVEQIAVEVCGPPEDVVLMMNQNISTPYDCCRHISLPLCERSPLALIDDKLLWDMHRPLPGNCKIKFLSFRDKDPYSLNEAFWRTGSFILGAVISKAFKDNVNVTLHCFPECRVNTGSFFYDVTMNLKAWQPTTDELKVLSAEFLSLTFQKLKIERLQVKKSIALKMFEDNPYKAREISKFAADSGGSQFGRHLEHLGIEQGVVLSLIILWYHSMQKNDNLVTLYRVGDYIDLASGPMVGDTSFFGRATVTSVHHVGLENSELYRFQAVALPKGIMLNQYAYSVLVDRGSQMNEIPVPGLPDLFQRYTEHSLKNSNDPINPNPFIVKF